MPFALAPFGLSQRFLFTIASAACSLCMESMNTKSTWKKNEKSKMKKKT